MADRKDCQTDEDSIQVDDVDKPSGLAEANVGFQPAPEADQSAPTLRIVAIGASAGGLEPLEVFFDAMPGDTGLAFVIVQHLSPDYKSLMNELLARHTDMEIHRAEDGMLVKANSIYLITPRKDLTIVDQRLRLGDRKKFDIIQMPINVFMQSLAAEKGGDAIGVIFSGTGTDGAIGAKAIRDAGGLVLVQAPETARFDGMPKAAIDSDAPHLVLSPADMVDILRRHVSGAKLVENGNLSPELVLDTVSQILDLLRRRFGPDFGYYKNSTVGRRIQRRADLVQVASLEDYHQLIKHNEEELEKLYHDLLIGVTAFFRDPESFSALEHLIVPEIGAVMSEHKQVRVWVPGCATGEEAYSIGIAFSEYAAREGKPLNIKIFATDIHEGSLQIAGEGFYQEEALANLKGDRKKRYFDATPMGYRVSPQIRRLVVFSKHNVLQDPPFRKVHLISCRNLLIYFTNIAQRKALSLFHFALEKDDVLFLGGSETVGQLEEEFDTVDARARIFKKKRDVRLLDSIQLLSVSTRPGEKQLPHSTRAPVVRLGQKMPSAGDGIYDRLLSQFMPPSILTDINGNILHIFGDAIELLKKPEPGEFSSRLADMIVPELNIAVSSAHERAYRHGLPAVARRVRAYPGGNRDNAVTVGVSAELVADSKEPDTKYCLVKLDSALIREPGEAEAVDATPADPTVESETTATGRIAELERQIRWTEENLQAAIEELETSNEELQASNEELQASNEELQSTNEELHSVNEELHTVSAEHERKIDELSQLNLDMDNLLRSTDIGTIFVDGNQAIRKFTPAAGNMFSLIDQDIGRPIRHITYNFRDSGFHNDVIAACESQIRSEREVLADDGNTYLMRILPYSRERGGYDGAVITFVDVSDLVEAKSKIERSEQRVRGFLGTASDWLWETDRNHRIVYTSEDEASSGLSSESVVGKTLWQVVGVDPSKDPDWAQHLANLTAHEPFRDFEYCIEADAGGKRYCCSSGTPIFGTGGQFVGYRGTARDISSQRSIERQLAASEARYRDIYNKTPAMMHSIDNEGALVSVSDFWIKVMGYERDDVLGRKSVDFLNAESRVRAMEEVLPNFMSTGSITGVPYKFVKKSGEEFDVLLSAISEKDSDGTMIRSLAVITDVSELQAAASEIEARNAKLDEANQELQQLNYVMSHDLRSPVRSCRLVLKHVIADLSKDDYSSVQTNLEAVSDRLGKMMRLIDGILDYSKVGKDFAEVELVNINDVIDGAIKLIDPPNHIEIRAQERLPTISGSPILFEHIFFNLIDNAIRHHDKAEGRIHIDGEEIGEDVVFRIEDDGPGIPDEYHNLVFELFRQIRASKESNGLGLALVKRAVEKQGGSIALDRPRGSSGLAVIITMPKQAMVS